MKSLLKQSTSVLFAAVFVAFCAGQTTLSAQDKAKGEKTYKAYCQTCHQPTGLGLPPAFPPLAKSDYLTSQSKDKVIQSVVFGLSGEITVNGKKYNGVMNPIPSNYTEKDVADVLTYVYGAWGNSGKTITEADVKAAKASYKKPDASGGRKRKAS
jgi:mono/diheme cytochrome c family protein